MFDSSSITTVSGGSSIESSLGASGDGHSFDLTAILGAVYHVGKLTLGGSVELPAVHVLGLYNATLHEEDGGPNDHGATLTTGHGLFRAPPPSRFALGVGIESGHWVVEADAALVVPVGPLSSTVSLTQTTLAGAGTSSSSRATYVVSEHPVCNPAVGFEYLFSRSFSVLGGLSTSVSTLSPLLPTSSLGNLAQDRMSSVDLSFGLGSYGGGTDLLVGAQFGYGWGQSIAVDPYVVPNQWTTAGVQSYSAMIVFAGAEFSIHRPCDREDPKRREHGQPRSARAENGEPARFGRGQSALPGPRPRGLRATAGSSHHGRLRSAQRRNRRGRRRAASRGRRGGRRHPCRAFEFAGTLARSRQSPASSVAKTRAPLRVGTASV